MSSESEYGALVEGWTLYSIGMSLSLLRLSLRTWKVGIRKLQLDDYCVVFTLFTYTLLLGSQNYIHHHDVDINDTSEEALMQSIANAKATVILEQAMINLIYTIKCCILVMVTRLIKALRLDFRTFLTGAAIYCVLGYIVTQIACWTTCLGSNQWVVPPPTAECATFAKYCIIELTFNVSSDLLILGIIIPILVATKLPTRQKVQLVLLYTFGIFIITAAIVTKVYQFSNGNVYVSSWAYISWYIREASVSVYLCNLPLIVPVLNESLHRQKEERLESVPSKN